MIEFIARRFLQAVLTLLVAISLVFIAVRVLPNNPMLSRLGQHAVPEKIEEQMAAQGWDRPVLEQLGGFLQAMLLRGDLGESFFRPGESIRDGLLNKLPATIELTMAALLLALPIGIAAGVTAAVWRNRWPDFLCMSGSLLGVSVPVFFLGICLLSVFSNMPTGLRLPAMAEFQSVTGFVVVETLLFGRFDLFADALRHLCLPAVALSSIPMAIIARVTRSSMLEVLSTDYVRTAQAKGAGPWRVVWRHAFPNASVAVSNIAGFQVGVLLSGAVLTETVFSWPGMGSYLVEGVQNSDYAVVQGGALVVAGMFVTINLLLDLVHAWLDPRIRREAGTP